MKNLVDTLLLRKDMLALAALVLITVAVRIPGVSSRAIWYDEAITLLETAGNAVPQWSGLPVPAATQQQFMVGTPSFAEIARGLRATDVHPPLYYGLLSSWRRVAGPSIEAARLFSVLCSTASVILLYLLLRFSGFAQPMAPSLVYSLSSGAVHYGHEARNYALAMLFVAAASLCAYIAAKLDENRPTFFVMISSAMAACCGLAFCTNYLSVFPIFALLLWFASWTLKKWKTLILIPIIITSGVSLTVVGTLMSQIGSRPHQFQRALGVPQEMAKIVQFNFAMIWSPVSENAGVFAAVVVVIVLLAVLAVRSIATAWPEVDARLLSLMLGLAVAPSLGVLTLDLVFSKDLGKSSYVIFALPAILTLLTWAVGERMPPADQRSSASLARGAGYAVAFFVGLQLTGINFGLERTPEFAGSTLRSLADRIGRSPASSVVVIGAGHGRGDPASLIYELEPDTTVCVIDRDSNVALLENEVSRYDEVWLVFARGRMTAAVEEDLFEALTRDGRYRAVSRAKRLAHLRKPRLGRRGD